jgi:tryptophan-rich sensory protein
LSTAPSRPDWSGWPGLLAFVVLCLGVGWIAGLVTAPAVADWYPTLTKPSWTPPPWAFPVVWPILYVMMGVAAWRVARAGASAARRRALGLFLLQLLLNGAWSFLFFGLRSPLLGLIDILLLLAAIAATILAFRRIDGIAAALMLPYLAWVAFATALNLEIWRLN